MTSTPEPSALAARQLTQGLSRARLVGWTMWLCYLSLAAQAAILIWVLRLLDRLESSGVLDGDPSEAARRAGRDVVDTLNGPVSTTTTVVTVCAFGSVLVTGVATLRWAGLARVIAESSGAVRMRYGPAARVFCWLVPVWNWFGPKQVINDLWTASDPQAGHHIDVMESTPPRHLLAWWLPWIVAPVFIWWGGRTAAATSVSSLRLLEYLLLLSLALSAVAGVFFVRIVRQIAQRQHARAWNLGYLPV